MLSTFCGMLVLLLLLLRPTCGPVVAGAHEVVECVGYYVSRRLIDCIALHKINLLNV